MQLPLSAHNPSLTQTATDSTTVFTIQPQTKRIAVIDTIRGVALLGILLIKKCNNLLMVVA